jgi:hypothetical protein
MWKCENECVYKCENVMGKKQTGSEWQKKALC